MSVGGIMEALAIRDLNTDGKLYKFADRLYYRAYFKKGLLSIDLFQEAGDKLVRSGQRVWKLDPERLVFEQITKP